MKGPVGEAGIAEARADRKDAPSLELLHRRHFAQPLNDGVVVDDKERLVTVNVRQPMSEFLSQIEPVPFPVAGQILASLTDNTVFVDQAGATDAEEGRQLQFVLGGVIDEALSHFSHAIDRDIARRQSPPRPR